MIFLFSIVDHLNSDEMLIEGDMVMSQDQYESIYGNLDLQKAIDGKRWPGGVIPYTMDNTFCKYF